MHATIRELGNAARVLLVIDQPVLAEYTKLALNHGAYLTRVTQQVDATLAVLASWRPHLAVVDMDLARGASSSGSAIWSKTCSTCWPPTPGGC